MCVFCTRDDTVAVAVAGGTGGGSEAALGSACGAGGVGSEPVESPVGDGGSCGGNGGDAMAVESLVCVFCTRDETVAVAVAGGTGGGFKAGLDG